MDINVVIDMPWLESATPADLKSVLNASSRYPEKLASLNALLATPEGMKIAHDMINDPHYVPVSKRPIDPADEAQFQADTLLAEQQAALDAQAQADEAAALEAAGTPVVEAPVVVPIEEKKKITIDYQVTAEDGTPIGRRTTVSGWSPEEIYKKLQDAHINAVRYAHRVSKNKVKDVEIQTELRNLDAQAKASEQEAADAVEVAAKEPAKLQDAIKKSSKADKDVELARQAALQKGQLIANAWVADHKDDFLPCDANTKLMGEWMAANQLTLTYENLERAFTANETKLVKPTFEQPVEEHAEVVPNTQTPAAATVAAPAPVIPAAAPAAAVPVSNATPPASQPTATAPQATSAAPANTAVARRPGVNGGLQPGTLTAGRPSGQATPQTTSAADFQKMVDKMPAPEFRKKVATSKEFREQLRAAGIPVLGEEQYKTSR
jgi:hypothetical protein